MKVLITTTGKAMTSKIDPRFGRAGLFAIADTDTDSFEVVANEDARTSNQGAGVKAAELAIRLGVKVVITGHCGPNAFTALSAAGIKVVSGAEGTVGQALDAFKTGSLKTISTPDVRGHWV